MTSTPQRPSRLKQTLRLKVRFVQIWSDIMTRFMAQYLNTSSVVLMCCEFLMFSLLHFALRVFLYSLPQAHSFFSPFPFNNFCGWFLTFQTTLAVNLWIPRGSFSLSTMVCFSIQWKWKGCQEQWARSTSKQAETGSTLTCARTQNHGERWTELLKGLTWNQIFILSFFEPPTLPPAYLTQTIH